MRDEFVLRCCSQAGTADRCAFLEAAEEAFGRPLDRELQAKHLLAFHKIATQHLDTFLSISQRATLRRGRPRPKRQTRSRAAVSEASPSHEKRSLVCEQLEGEPWFGLPGTIPLTQQQMGVERGSTDEWIEDIGKDLFEFLGLEPW